MADRNYSNRLTEPSERVSGQSSGSFRGGICQAIRATDYKDPPKVLVESTIPITKPSKDTCDLDGHEIKNVDVEKCDCFVQLGG